MSEYYKGPSGLTPFTRARAEEVHAEFKAVGDSFERLGERALQTEPGDTIGSLPTQESRKNGLPVFDLNGDVQVLRAPDSLIATDALGRPVAVNIVYTLAAAGADILDDGVRGGGVLDDGIRG